MKLQATSLAAGMPLARVASSLPSIFGNASEASGRSFRFEFIAAMTPKPAGMMPSNALAPGPIASAEVPV